MVRRVAGTLATLATLGLLLGLGGCARQQWKFDNLEKRDQLRFAACRKDVARHICPDDPDCEAKAAQMYADERPDARLQWLLDYNCPRVKIQHADQAWERQERERLGM